MELATKRKKHFYMLWCATNNICTTDRLVFTQRFVCKNSSDYVLWTSTSVVICLFYPTSRASALNCVSLGVALGRRLKGITLLFTNHDMLTLTPVLRNIWRLIKTMIIFWMQLYLSYTCPLTNIWCSSGESTLLLLTMLTGMLKIQCWATTHIVMVLLAGGAWEDQTQTTTNATSYIQHNS